MPSASAEVRDLLDRLDDFPFAAEIRRRTGVMGRPAAEAEERLVLRTLLDEMRYAELPKALIPFHVGESPRTAFEEHLLEGARYLRAGDGTCRMHFTVAPAFRHEFETLLRAVRDDVERRCDGARLSVSFSEQNPATDTLALDGRGAPLRDQDGRLVFRPGGHGALLRNLSELRGDLVVIRNIDNIAPDEASAEGEQWKRLLIGQLVVIEEEIASWLARVEGGDTELGEGLAFVAAHFGRRPWADVRGPRDARAFLRDALTRPLRVCGVVRNEGEPGGAPFWVRGADGSVTLQIVESSQVDTAHADQARIFHSSTHFNPVDIIASVRNAAGEPFDLDAFVDPSTAFVAEKSHQGQRIKVLERPGLWNGAMAHWNTVFVEVPGSTFTPVKTVFDLLRPEHQAGASGIPASRRR